MSIGFAANDFRRVGGRGVGVAPTPTNRGCELERKRGFMYEGTLSRPMSDDADRGQLLVIVGLIIAVSFIGLAVALNAAIFSENLSTRESVDAEEAAAYAAGVEPAIGDAYDETNDAGAATAADAQAEFGDLIGEWETAREREAATEGADFGLDRTAHVGWRLEQDANRSFAPANDTDATDWTVADDARDIAGFRLNVSRDDLYDGVGNFSTLESDAFRVSVSDGTTDWELYIFRNSGNSTVVVYNGDPTTSGSLGDLLSASDSCTAATDRAVVDFRAATLNGSTCDALAFDDDLEGNVSVRYENVQDGGSERVNGTYRVVVNSSDAVATTSGQPDRFNASGASAPTATAVVYAVSYDSHYRRNDVVHDRKGRYAPRAEAY